MIIYAYVMGESVAALFLAGIVPGIMIGLGLMAVVKLMADKYDFPVAARKTTWGERGQASLKAFWPLLTPVIILGGILGGVFTPTEAAAVAVAYATFIGFFVLKTLTLKDMPDVLAKAAATSAVVLLLVGAAMAFKTVVSLSHAPEILAEWILSLTNNPLVLLFLINLLLFVVGMFLDAGPAIIILGPILGPIFVSLGVDPIHFAIIMSVNLTVGLATPPMGLVLFVASSVSGEKVERIAKAILPFLAVEIFVIFLITYIPAISMTIPRLTGFAN
jgi:tripartite ATP-independent transporter DctM subunit